MRQPADVRLIRPTDGNRWLLFAARGRTRPCLERHIDMVAGLIPSVHARFVDDLVHGQWAIESAHATVVRWEGYRAEAAEAARTAKPVES